MNTDSKSFESKELVCSRTSSSKADIFWRKSVQKNLVKNSNSFVVQLLVVVSKMFSILQF